MTVLDFAKDYMDHGYWVIPTIRADKKPAIPWKTYQTEKPTYDDLECWFSEDRNIAVICGAGSGVVGIDADDKAAEWWWAVYGTLIHPGNRTYLRLGR